MSDDRPNTSQGLPSLTVLKALADDSRHRIYHLLAAAPEPLATAEIAEAADLHPNTVRPHLERLREAGLVELVVAPTGSVGRPQHRYRVADAGGPPDPAGRGVAVMAGGGVDVLDRMLIEAAVAAGLSTEDVLEPARAQGRLDARASTVSDTVEILASQQTALGFAPALSRSARTVTVAFTACPYRDLAAEHPELVCGIHCGLVEGVVEEAGDCQVLAFHSIGEREACRVELVAR